MEIPWVHVSIAVGVIVLAALGILWLRKGGWERAVDYRRYFNIGVTWLPLGIAFYIIFENIVGLWFLLMGLGFLSIGLKNRDKWGKPQKVSPTYQKLLMISMLLGVLVLIVGIIVFELLYF